MSARSLRMYARWGVAFALVCLLVPQITAAAPQPPQLLEPSNVPNTLSVAEGELDPTFGTGGKVTTNFVRYVPNSAYAMALQNDGKMLVAGANEHRGAVARYNPDGSLDTTFGTGGIVTPEALYGEGSGVRRIRIQQDGKVLLIAIIVSKTCIRSCSWQAYLIVLRLMPNGALDTNFGYGGTARANLPTGPCCPALTQIDAGLDLQADGKIVAVGFASGATTDFVLARFNQNGALDTGFGSAGVVTTSFGSGEDSASSVTVQPDGKVVIAGFTTLTSPSDRALALARYNSEGTLDVSFNDTGKVVTRLASAYAQANALALLPGGGIVVAGSTGGANSLEQFLLVQYKSNGILDGNFGDGGIVTTPFDGTHAAILDIAVQADRKLVAVGYARAGSAFNAADDFALARYNPDGSLDGSFGSGGRVRTDFNVRSDAAAAVALQADGKIVAAGTSTRRSDDPFSEYQNTDFAVSRYNQDGTLDTLFGVSGKVTTDIVGVSSDTASDVLAQPDGKLVVVGSGWTGEQYGGLVVRYNADGNLDSSFGDGGKVALKEQSGRYSPPSISTVALQPDNKIVVAGAVQLLQLPMPYADFYIARLNPDGSLDETFGNIGIATMDFGGLDNALDIAILPSGKIVAIGETSSGGKYDFAVTRFNPDGSPDVGFGSGGKVRTVFGNGSARSKSVALQGDGKFVVAGDVYFSISNEVDFALARYNLDGSMDNSFGTGGRVMTSLEASSTEKTADRAEAVAIQPDGKIVATGSIDGLRLSTSVAVARYLPDGSLDPTFGFEGKVRHFFRGNDYADGARDLAVLANGKLVVVGGYNQFSLMRLQPDGSLDRAFGGDGDANTTVGTTSSDRANAVTVQPDGKLVVAGGADSNFVLLRYQNSTTCPSGSYYDVPAQQTFYPYVQCLMNKAVIGGYWDCSFRPNNSVTRGQLAKIVANSAGFNEPVAGQTFADVAPDSAFYLYVERMASRGIIGGYACDAAGEACDPQRRPYFRPNSNATRGQIAKIVANAGEYSDTPTGQTFEDVPPTSPFYLWVERLASRGVMGGYACGAPGEPCRSGKPYFRPQNNATRGQTSKIVANTFFPECQATSQP